MRSSKSIRFLPGYTRLEKSWVVYDVGNSAFTLMVSTIIPIWFNALAERAGMSSVDYLANWSFATSIATIIMALWGPILGSLADHRGYKKPFFTAALLIGVIGCAFLGLVGILPFPVAAGWMIYLVVYIISKVSYQSSLVLYDSMLVDVTEPERMDIVSSNGFAWGYIGSCIPFIIALVLYLLGTKGVIPLSAAIAIDFILVAAWWFGITTPLLRLYHQKHCIETKGSMITESFGRLGRTLKELIRKDHKVLFFL